MKLPKSLLRLRKLKQPFLLRRVTGDSMLPTFKPGQLVFGRQYFMSLKPGDVVIVTHQEIEKIKRIKAIENESIWLEGDNPSSSTDSRHFGLINCGQVIAKILAPAVSGKLIKHAGGQEKRS